MGFAFSGRVQTAPINSYAKLTDYVKIGDFTGKKWQEKRRRKSWKTEKCRSDGAPATSHHQIHASTVALHLVEKTGFKNYLLRWVPAC
jgi:hypothetical protein